MNQFVRELQQQLLNLKLKDLQRMNASRIHNHTKDDKDLNVGKFQ